MVTITIPLIPVLIGIGTFFVGILPIVGESDMTSMFIILVIISAMVFFASYGLFTMLGMI